MIRMIMQYLKDEGFGSTFLTIQDEANVKLQDQKTKTLQTIAMKKAILEGDWTEAEKLCTKETFKHEKQFVYAVYKQIYLEMIEKQDYQKAFTYLTKKLKPLESKQAHSDEFKDLCFLLTCKSVQDLPSFKNWNGNSSREQLVEAHRGILEIQKNPTVMKKVPARRLQELLCQALEYQLDANSYRPTLAGTHVSLFKDFSTMILPNASMMSLKGHRANVKSIAFLGERASIITGSSDNSVKVWSAVNGSCLRTLSGHQSRIWNVSTHFSSQLIATASGDSTIKLWNLSRAEGHECIQSFQGHDGDVYSVQFNSDNDVLLSAGYDKTVRIFDVGTGHLKKAFAGHSAPVSRAVWNPSKNLIISGGKDRSIKFWDVSSGSCIKTVSHHLGEVTSVEVDSTGNFLLTNSKDNSIRLWDLRNGQTLMRYRGHQNTSKNFIRSNFGPNEKLIVSGSENGTVYIWDRDSGEVVQQLRGHKSIVFEAVWSDQHSLLASCSEDARAKVWWYDQSKPLFWNETTGPSPPNQDSDKDASLPFFELNRDTR
eukprot:TRINITY_DN1841_c0_g1_i2.p1 TRINITY_DN1841_c0_g1~~TRINITY_DN1841_c0_g1_i2.p1  ORF type:complete len:540 (-),score=74.69 TRINITY_DN1841_c0_g1_i2:1460-3079(-)